MPLPAIATRFTLLLQFLDHSGLPIGLHIGLDPIDTRKNWLLCWTEVGAKYLGVLQSLIVTCRLQGINPYDYLVDVLQRIDQHLASQVSQLTPRRWKQHRADNPL